MDYLRNVDIFKRMVWIVALCFKITEAVYVSEDTQSRRIHEELSICFQRITTEKYPQDGGVYCNVTWDDLACWGFTRAGDTATIKCPDYFNKFDPGANATRTCLRDGTWYVHPLLNKTWTNYTECFIPEDGNNEISDYMKRHLSNIQVMTDVGYGLSLISLITAVIIMLTFRRLHCARNTIHIHLFVSFIFRSSMSLMKDNLLVESVGFASDVTYTEDGTLIFLAEGTHWECKLFFTLFNYFLNASYAWILLEGLYLHTLLTVAVFSESSSVIWFIIAGWALPVINIIPWIIVRALLEDKLCWNTHDTEGYFWILKGPIVLIIVINFIFFIRIVRLLFTKLVASIAQDARKFRYSIPWLKSIYFTMGIRTSHKEEEGRLLWSIALNVLTLDNSMARCSFRDAGEVEKLAKSTLVLIPVFGVHYIVFLGLPKKVNDHVEIVKLYYEMFFNAFQGLFVAILFCFLNGEVRSEIRKKWERYQLQRTGGAGFGYTVKMSTFSTYVQRSKHSSSSENVDLTSQQHNGHNTTPLVTNPPNNYYSK